MPTPLPMVRPDDEVTAEGENDVRRAVNGLLGLRVDGASMTLSWMGGIPYLSASAGLAVQWFYTTSTISAASASATGTALGSATMTDGHGTARRCVTTISGTTVTRTPDTNASDDTIYLGSEVSSIATGMYVRCILVDGVWEVDFIERCPGS